MVFLLLETEGSLVGIFCWWDSILEGEMKAAVVSGDWLHVQTDLGRWWQQQRGAGRERRRKK